MAKKKPGLYAPLKKIDKKTQQQLIACCERIAATLSVAIQKRKGDGLVRH